MNKTQTIFTIFISAIASIFIGVISILHVSAGAVSNGVDVQVYSVVNHRCNDKLIGLDCDYDCDNKLRYFGCGLYVQHSGSHPKDTEFGASTWSADQNHNCTFNLDSCEDDWPDGDDTCGTTTSPAIFTSYSQLYTTTGATSAHAGEQTCGGDADADFRIRWKLRPSITESVAAGLSGIDLSGIDFTWPVPSGTTVRYYYRLNQVNDTSGSYNTKACDGSTDYLCDNTTSTSPPGLLNLPAGNWYLHVRPYDNNGAGDPAKAVQSSVLSLNDAGLSNAQVRWTAGDNSTEGISGSEFTFNVDYKSYDDAAYSGVTAAGGNVTPDQAYIEIDIDNDGVADSIQTDASCSGPMVTKIDMSPSGSSHGKSHYISGVTFEKATVVCYKSSVTKGNWNYRYVFHSNQVTQGQATFGGNTYTTTWQSFKVAPVELYWGYGTDAASYKGHDKGTSADNPQLGKWQTTAIPEPAASSDNREITFKVKYRYSGADAITLAAAPANILGGYTGSEVGITDTAACSYTPRVEIDIDNSSDGSSTDVGTPDYCVAMTEAQAAGGLSYEREFATEAVALPFTDLEAANSGATFGSNPPDATAINGNKIARYKYRFVFDDGAGGSFPDGDIMNDIRSGGTGVGIDDVSGTFDDATNLRSVYIKKNPLVMAYADEANYKSDSDTFGRGVSPNCGYGGSVTARHSADPASGNVPTGCSGDTPSQVSPAYSFKVHIYDPDGLPPSLITTSDAGTNGITATDASGNTDAEGSGSNYYIVTGVDLDDSGQLGDGTWDTIREVKPMSCTLQGNGSDPDALRWSQSGALCSHTISAGQLRYAPAIDSDSPSDYDGKLRYAFAFRTRYYQVLSSDGTSGATGDYYFNDSPDAVGTWSATGANANKPDLDGRPYIQIFNNQPFIIFQQNALTLDPTISGNACYSSAELKEDDGGVTPKKTSTDPECRRGGKPHLFRIRFVDYDGYLPGHGSWSNTDKAFRGGSDPTNAALYIDLNNDGDFDDTNPYPWADVSFEDAASGGEKLRMTAVSGTQWGVDSSNAIQQGVSSCSASETSCISELYEIELDHIFFHYVTGGAYTATGDGIGNHRYQFVFKDDNAVSATGKASEDNVKNLAILNNKPILHPCGSGFESMNSGAGWSTALTVNGTPRQLNFDYEIPGSYFGPEVYPATGRHNTEYGGFNNDYIHPLDYGYAALDTDNDTNPDNPDASSQSAAVYSADNHICGNTGSVSLSCTIAEDKTYDNDIIRFCVRYVDEDRFPPNADTVKMALKTNESATSWETFAMSKLISLLDNTADDTDAGATASPDNNDPLKRGIVYFKQQTMRFRYTDNGATGDSRQGTYDLDGAESVTDTSVKLFRDAADLQPGIATGENHYILKRVTPSVTAMYKWGVDTTNNLITEDAGGTTGLNLSSGETAEFWPQKSLYHAIDSVDPSSSGSPAVTDSTDWSGATEKAIAYWLTWFNKDYTDSGPQSSSAAVDFTGQKYYGGSQSGCINGSDYNSGFHIKKLSSGTPHVEVNTSCYPAGATLNTHDQNNDLAALYKPAQKSTENIWEAFTRFSFANPLYSGKGRIGSFSLADSPATTALYGYTGTVFEFKFLWWKPGNIGSEPDTVGVGIDTNRNGIYDKDELVYIKGDPYAEFTDNDPDFGRTLSSAKYCSNQIPGTTLEQSRDTCRPYILYNNVQPDKDSLPAGIKDGDLIGYHYAFHLKETYPPQRHDLTYDPGTEIFMGYNRANAAPIMLEDINDGVKKVTPFDPYLIVKYRSPPGYEAAAPEEISPNTYVFKVNYVNPYKIAPGCLETACSEGVSASVFHYHICIDENANNSYEDASECHQLTYEPQQATVADDMADGILSFRYPRVGGHRIKFYDKHSISYEYRFTEYEQSGKGKDRGLSSYGSETIEVTKLTEPLVVRNNYQHPQMTSDQPVKILVGNRAGGQSLQGKYSVRIYSVTGKVVFDGNGNWLDKSLSAVRSEDVLQWDLRSNKGHKVGSGVYLVVLVREIDGKREKPYTQKVVVVRGADDFAWE